jgi:alanine racemase
VASITMMTHFANADDAHPLLPIAEQIRRFEAGTAGLAGRAACRIRPACCCTRKPAQ